MYRCGDNWLTQLACGGFGRLVPLLSRATQLCPHPRQGQAMISYDQALALVLQHATMKHPATERVPLAALPGRICVTSLVAPFAVAPFDNSAMDGFAVRSADLVAASPAAPVSLRMAGHLAAGGAQATQALEPGWCYEIMTGAAIAPGCDAVVQVEATARDGAGRVVFVAPAPAGQHIRGAGLDFAAGDPVLPAGRVVEPSHLLALASLGIADAEVVVRPKVALLSTGLEVVDDLAQPLQAGQIYNATNPYLQAVLVAAGADVVTLPTVADEATVFAARVRDAAAQGCQLMVSTGAVSAGTHDFVPGVLAQLGAQVVFHKVAIRPGKPVFFAVLPGGMLYLGLPGNPASTAVGWRFFGQPALRALQCLPPEQPLWARLTEPYKKKPGLRVFLRAQRQPCAQACTCVQIVTPQQSFMVRPFLHSNVWVALPEDGAELPADSLVPIYL